MLTDPGILISDPFAGSYVAGEVAQGLGYVLQEKLPLVGRQIRE